MRCVMLSYCRTIASCCAVSACSCSVALSSSPLSSVTVFCVNRDLKEDYELEIDLRSFTDEKTQKSLQLQEHILLHNDDVNAVNTEENPDNVRPAAGPGGTVDGGRACIRIPALSWNVLRFVP